MFKIKEIFELVDKEKYEFYIEEIKKYEMEEILTTEDSFLLKDIIEDVINNHINSARQSFSYIGDTHIRETLLKILLNSK